MPVAAFVLLLSGVPSSAAAVLPSAPDNYTNVAVLDRSTGPTVYVGVPGGLFARTLPRSDEFLEFRSFAALPTAARAPRALATRRDKLIVVDHPEGSSPTLLEIDPATRLGRVIHRGLPLRQPVAVSVSPEGAIVVADAANRVLLLFLENEDPVSVPWPVENLTAITFYGPELYALDGPAGQVRLVERTPNPDRPPFSVGLTDLKGFGIQRGIGYFTDGRSVHVSVSGEAVRPLTACAVCPKMRAGPLVATGERLIIADTVMPGIWSLTRPVPVRVEVQPDDQGAGLQGLSEFYRRLAETGWLPLTTRTAAQRYDSVLSALQGFRVVLPGEWPALAKTFDNVLCSANRPSCSAQGDMLKSALAAGESLTVPDFVLEPVPQTTRTVLQGRSVEDLVKGQTEARGDALARLIAGLNPGTLETELTRRGLVMATPASEALRPGAIIEIAGSREMVVDSIEQACPALLASSPRIKSGPATGLPLRLVTRSDTDIAPATCTAIDPLTTPSGTALQEERVVSFEAPKLEKLDLSIFAGRSPACAPGDAGASRYLIVESLLVYYPRFDWVKADGVAQASISERPVYIGYRAVPLGALASGSEKSILAAAVSPAAVRPGGPQDILHWRDGELVLPSRAWRFEALVPAVDLGRDGFFQALGARNDHKMVVLSRESVRTQLEAAFVPFQPEAVDDAKARELKAERARLEKVIGYEDLAAEANATAVVIGIGEHQLDCEHPGFIDTDDDGQIRCAVVNATLPAAAQPGQASRRDFNTNDHGYHVAGLLAARSTAIVPGLVPNARLRFIPSASFGPTTLSDALKGGASERPAVFNFSISLPSHQFPEAAAQQIKDVFMDNVDAQNALFVVAAGDDGKDLARIDRLPFITWVPDFRNMLLGVGAATKDGTKYCQTRRANPDTNDDTINVSNCGRKGVEIAAPGEDVLSLAAGNAYAATDGSSQAVPQVTAAAAMLFAQNRQYRAASVKARLLYTTDWVDDDFAKCVWSGLLNVRRAVWKPEIATYRTKADKGIVRTAQFAPAVLTVLSAEPDDPQNEAPKPDTIALDEVLRLVAMKDGLYRVFYMRNGLFAVAKKARLHGTLQCRNEQQWEPGTDGQPGRFVTATWKECGRDLSEFLYDYVAPVPRDVKFAAR